MKRAKAQAYLGCAHRQDKSKSSVTGQNIKLETSWDAWHLHGKDWIVISTDCEECSDVAEVRNQELSSDDENDHPEHENDMAIEEESPDAKKKQKLKTKCLNKAVSAFRSKILNRFESIENVDFVTYEANMKEQTSNILNSVENIFDARRHSARRK